MSTRAIVAQPYGDSWRGRHTHSDGYPSGRGKELWALVRRDGVERVRKVITEDYYGWSSIDADQHDLEGVRVPKTSDSAYAFGYGTPEFDAFMLGPNGMYGDGRFVNVPGYGIAYTTHQGQSDPDEWLTPEDTGDTEWAYVLADDALWVLVCHFGPAPTLVGTYRWDEPEPNWESIEEEVRQS